MAKRNALLKKNSQSLRKNMTEQEKNFWYKFLKNLPVQFYRQKVIENYIVDFCCARLKLIIEIDGSQHFEKKGEAADIVRDKRLNELGYTVLRYSNKDINENFRNVCEDIYRYLNL